MIGWGKVLGISKKLTRIRTGAELRPTFVADGFLAEGGSIVPVQARRRRYVAILRRNRSRRFEGGRKAGVTGVPGCPKGLAGGRSTGRQ